MHYSKLSKFARAVAALVVGAGTLAAVATPSMAETFSQAVLKGSQITVNRTIDSGTHHVQFYAGEYFNLSVQGSFSSAAKARMSNGSSVTADSGYSLVSGTISEGSVSLNSSLSTGMGAPTSTMTGSVTGTYSTVPTGLSINLHVSGMASTDVVLNFNPVITITTSGTPVTVPTSEIDGYRAQAQTSVTNPTGGVVAKAADASYVFITPQMCVDTASLVATNVVNSATTVSDGTSNVGTDSPWWNRVDSSGNFAGQGAGSPYTLPSLSGVSRLAYNGQVTVSSITAGRTYTFGTIAVTKQGDSSNTNLLKSCGTTAAVPTAAVNARNILISIDASADVSTGMMPTPLFDFYRCNLYASTDTGHTNVIMSSQGWMMGMGGPTTTTTCPFMNVPAGTYSYSIRGMGMSGTSGVADEKFASGTVVVSGTVAKTNPAVPAVSTTVKVGKTFLIATPAGKNSQGLTTVVTSTTKSLCTSTVKKTGTTINGYTIKGIKKGACKLTVAITGNTAYNTKSTVKTVTVK